MSGEQWGEAVDAARHAVGLNLHDATRAIEAAAPLIVADTRRQIAQELWPVLIAHQRHRGGCLCGWAELGRCHAKHIIAAWEAALRGETGEGR